MSTTITEQPLLGKKKGILTDLNPIVLIGSLFFVFGFITWLNSVLIPYLKIACELNNLQSYLVAFSFYIAYLFMAIPSAKILSHTGFKKGMALGLGVMAVGALIFIPAALSRMYYLFLLGLFLQGTGLALLQTAANPYVTILGPIESAAKRISIMGICNKLAGAIAPLILGSVALKNMDSIIKKVAVMSPAEKNIELTSLSTRVILPYICIIAGLLILACIIYFSSLPEVALDKTDKPAAGSSGRIRFGQFPQLTFGVLAMFLCVGVEVIAGDTIISYAFSQGIALSTAKYFTTCTLIFMILGYCAGIISIPRYISQQAALRVCAVLGLIFTTAALITSGGISVFFIALLGLANSLMFPAIFPLAIDGLGRYTKMGSSFLIMAIAGGAIIPLLYGRLADLLSMHYAYVLVLPCYLILLYYGMRATIIRRVA
jgi:FHS family L-fucose permease-like MFS transporter